MSCADLIGHLFLARDVTHSVHLNTASAAAPAAGDDMVAQLQKLADLKAAGVLSEEEFAAAKAKVLAGS